MEKLTAVNKMLRLIGTRKVTSLSVRHPDVVDAIDLLDEWIRNTLGRGWWFNEVKAQTYQPDHMGNIVFAQNLIRFEWIDGDSLRSSYPTLSKRNTRLYDGMRMTYTFTHEFTFDTYVLLEWDDLPLSAQNYIVNSAGAELVRDKIEDSAKEASVLRDAEKAYAELDAEDMRMRKYNMFNAPGTASIRHGRRPYGR